MARGQIAPFSASLQEAVLPPPFLQRDGHPSSSDQSPFVGRERELAWFRTHLDMALAGNGHAAFILGDAGCGKTMLMAEFARRAQAAYANLIVADSFCNAQAGIGDPLLPFRDLLRLLTGDLEARWIYGTLSREQVLRLWSLLPSAQAILERAPNR